MSTNRLLAFPTDPSAARQRLIVRCLETRVETNEEFFPRSWLGRRTVILDTTGRVRGDDGAWIPLRKTVPNLPEGPAVWRPASADSVDMQVATRPIGFRVRLSLFATSQPGRVVMTNDAGNTWIPDGQWRFIWKACGT